MRGNADWIHQFHSADDHLITVAEGRYVAEMIEKGEGGGEFVYEELNGQSHLVQPFDEILDAIDKRVAK
jgi:hypothetical protein